MAHSLSKPCTAFDGVRLLASGPLIEVALAVKHLSESGASEPVLVFDDATGRVVDLDLRGTEADVIARLSQATHAGADRANTSGTPSNDISEASATKPRGRGRPKLGVVGREVTLLPRHWDWLAAQPGGASVALRKLVEEARRTGGARQQMRAAQEAAYQFMSAMAGDLSGFEEATRALFANDRSRFDLQIANWPEAVRDYATRLAFAPSADASSMR